MKYALEMAPTVRFLSGCATSSCLSGDLAEESVDVKVCVSVKEHEKKGETLTEV